MQTYSKKGVKINKLLTAKEYGGVYIDLQGIEGVQKLFRELELSISTKVLGKALVYGVKPLIKAARQNAPVSKNRTGFVSIHRHFKKGKVTELKRIHQSGDLKKSINYKLLRHYPPAIYVGPGRGVGKKYDAYYGQWVEFGSENQEAKPFIRPAWDMTKREVIDRISEYTKEIIKSIKPKKLRIAA